MLWSLSIDDGRKHIHDSPLWKCRVLSILSPTFVLGCSLLSTPLMNVKRLIDAEQDFYSAYSYSTFKSGLDQTYLRRRGMKIRIFQSVQGIQVSPLSNIRRLTYDEFLLAQLYLHSLIGKRSSKATRSVMKTLPSGPQAYDYSYDNWPPWT